MNGFVTFYMVLSVLYVRDLSFLEGVKLYWQRSQDNARDMRGVLGGGNILGGVLEGGK